jgi:hypothetical protein
MIKNKSLAPISLFVYKRIDCLVITINSLKNNTLAKESELFIFSDGYKNELDKDGVLEVRKYLKSINGFKNVIIIESDVNVGLANSIIRGVSFVLTKFESIIVLEDDLETSQNFLNFMNESLCFFCNNDKIISVCGYSSPISKKYNEDIYFTHRSSSWGWGTWKNRWDKIDWLMNEYSTFSRNKSQIVKFKKMGSDMNKMLKNQYNRKIDSWAIRFSFHQFNQGLYSVHPTISKVNNIGMKTNKSTHTYGMEKRFETTLDNNLATRFNFDIEVSLDPIALADFLKPYTLQTRIIYKLLKIIKFFKL